MANKPFAIQGADLTLGGVNLQAGTTGVVIPGVTRATSYVPEEVNDTGDQTHAFNSPPVVIDHTYYSILNGDYSPSRYTEAEYAVTELDGDDYIDGIDIVSQGSGWDLTSANSAQNNDMWAYVGPEQNPFATFVNTDWIQIPFRVKIRAGEVETIGGGSGSGLVQRTVNFPTGEEGDTKGTMALTPGGTTYICIADWPGLNEPTEYSVVASENYNKNQSINGTDMVLTVAKGDNTDLDNVMQSLTLPSTAWKIYQNSATDGATWDCVADSKDSTHWSFTWQFHAGNDNSSFSQNDEFALFYTVPQAKIWRQADTGLLHTNDNLITTGRDMSGGEGLAYIGNDNIDFYVQNNTDRSWAEVWIQNGNTATPHVDIITRAASPNWNNSNMKTWSFKHDGSLSFPDGTIQTTAYTGTTVDFTAPLPSWLTVVGNTQHFPTVNYDYGFDSTGVWTVNATIQNANDEGTSYPFRTTFTVPSNFKTVTTVDFIVNDMGADFGIGVFATGTDPVWAWDGTTGNSGANRIGAQYNGALPELHGISGGADNGEGWGLPGSGTYRARLTVLPTGPSVAEITLETLDTNNTVLDTITYTENSFFQTNYRIGFASDQDNGIDKTYFKNLTIDVDNGTATYTDALTGYDSTLAGGGSGTGAELVGDGYATGTGYKRVVYTDWQGYQGGESNGILVAGSDVVGIQVGDTITFRNGEVRTITSFDTGYNPQVYVQWDSSVNGDWNNPRFPMTFTSASYVAETKPTARIKPDSMLVGSGQYMEVYAGGPTVVDQKHIHMAGANADTELFLGTDNNFVSSKEAGLSPARVNLKSENDITVSDTNLRMSRGNTWLSVYGDGINRNQHGGSFDLTWNVIESDEQGNFYVGGESCAYPEAIVAKYGPDGDLLWNKIVNAGNGNTNGWKPDGVAYNPVDKEVAVAVRTNANRNYDYYKVNVLDSESGDFKSVFDLYDADGNVTISNMTWHPTLSWIAVGYTHGESVATPAARTAYESVVNLTTTGQNAPQGEIYVNDIGTIPSVGDYFEYVQTAYTVISVNTYSGYYGLVTNVNANFGVNPEGGDVVVLHHNSKSGVGIIELPVASVKIAGAWPDRNSGNWSISGTGITGNQVLQYGGPGLYQNVPVTNLTNPTDTGLTVGIRVDYAAGYYDYFTTNTPGTGVWAYNDDFKIPGSLLGGVDSVTIGTYASSTYNGGSTYFDKATYPTFNTDITVGMYARFENLGQGTVTRVYEADPSNWGVDVTMNYGQSMTGGNVTFLTGNDIVGKIADLNGIQNGFAGTPNTTGNYHIDMGFMMGYGSTDFASGTFTLTSVTDNRAFVWNHGGPAGWNKVYNPVNLANTSSATCVTVHKASGDIIVGGMDNTSGKGFVWKLDAAGTTSWVKGLDNDTNQVNSVAVSELTGEIYYTTNNNSVNKLSSSGDLIKRVEPNGMWGMNTPVVKLEQGLDGAEHLYVAGSFGAIWVNNAGFMVTKLTSDLRTMWTRDFWSNNRQLSDQYEDFHNHIALGRDKVVMVGYTHVGSFNNSNGYLASITTGDTFELVQLGEWHLDIPGGDIQYQDHTNDYTTYNFITEGGSTGAGSLSLADDNGAQEWTNWGWKSSIIKLDHDKGIKGVESIHFAEGGKLDHNPADIPPVLTDFNQSWNYTLKLSDRGKFIVNQPQPNAGYCNHLYITVPSNINVSFPVGSVITLINTDDVNNNGYKIYVQPEYYFDNSNITPKIWAAGSGNQNPSTWSFQGMQTATLMKIGSNEWMLTCNNPINED